MLVNSDSTFLIPILEPLTHNEFTVKDSFSFAKVWQVLLVESLQNNNNINKISSFIYLSLYHF